MSGTEVRERRRRAGLTQTEIASHLGVTNVTICRWERGTNRMGSRYAYQIERVLATYEKYLTLAREELASVA